MRILFVNTFYYPNMPGGSEQSVKLLAEGLAAKGHDVGVFCIDLSQVENNIDMYNGVKIFRKSSYGFKFYRKKKSFLQKVWNELVGFCNTKCLKDFEEVCLKFKPDIVHTNSVYGMSPFVWKVACKLSIPVVHTVRDIGLISPVQYGHKCNVLLRFGYKLYVNRLSRYVTAVTAPSSYTLNSTLEKVSFKNAIVKACIFNSVKIDYNKLNEIINNKYKRKDKTIKFMFAGRLVYFKGISYMINTFEKLKSYDCELHICGNGEMREFVEQWSSKDSRIIYHGKLNNIQLQKCYEDCDVLIVPSCWPEPFGRVLIEGNMYGLPVIACRFGGIPEIIDNTKSGVLCIPGDEKDLKSKMIKFMYREHIQKYFNNIKQNISKYDVSEQIVKFEKLYFDVVEKRCLK